MQMMLFCDKINLVIYMRIRNVKNKENILNNSKHLITDPEKYIGKWNELFKNNNPICIEIGMGKGKFIREMARTYPNINFIGIEKYDSIIAKCLPKIDDDISNLIIVRMNALNIDNVFSKEVDRIYLNFSDPWPKVRHHFRRLTSNIFLDKYDKIFKDKKSIYMRTDNQDLFIYSLESFSKHEYYLHNISFDLHKSSDEELITTEYEDKFSAKNMPIYFVFASSEKDMEN